MSLELDLLEIYEKSLKEGTDQLLEVPHRKPPAPGQIRELWSLPLERFMVLEEVSEGLYLTVPLTSYLQLLPHSSPVYEIKSRGLRLGVVPVWDYLRQELIENYSQVIGRVSQDQIQKVKDYITKTKDLRWATKRFISLNSKRWAKWTMHSLLAQADLAEEIAQIVHINEQIQKDLSSYRTYALAAENKYFKGSNFFAVLRENLLRLYLPVEYVGKRLKVLVGSVVVFEGELESVKLDLVGDFSGINLEEELRIVEL